jgi:hypothetical protein
MTKRAEDALVYCALAVLAVFAVYGWGWFWRFMLWVIE